MSFTYFPVDDLIRLADRGERAVMHMSPGQDIHLPGPSGYEWVLHSSAVQSVELQVSSATTTNNPPGRHEKPIDLSLTPEFAIEELRIHQ